MELSKQGALDKEVFGATQPYLNNSEPRHLWTQATLDPDSYGAR